VRASPLWALRSAVRPHAWGLALVFLTALAMIAVGLVVPPLTGAAVDAARAGDTGRVELLAAALLGAGAIEAVLAFVRRYSAALFSIRIERDLRERLYAHLQRLPLDVHDRWHSGQLLSRLMSDLSTIRRFLGFGAVFLVVNALQFVAVIVLMARLHVGLTALTTVIAVPTAWATASFRRKYKRVSRLVQDEQCDLATEVEEAAAGIRIIKAFGRGPHVSQRFEAQAERLRQASLGAVRMRAVFWTLLKVLPNLNLVAVVGIGAAAIVSGGMTPGELTTFISYLLMLGWPIQSVGWILAMAEEATTAAQRVLELLDTPVAIADAPDAAALDAGGGSVSFDGVWFRYPGSEKWILQGADLEVAPGETMALVGATGCGKSTLAMLVARLYDVDRGEVRVNGTDVRRVTLASLRSQVGMAFEDPTLFSMSVVDNLRLGRADADDDELRDALTVAGALFAYDLPDGLDTRIGEHGLALSGGQRQRIALARAIIGRPAVLVLDDPLSAVDVHTESLIEAALRRALAHVTAVVVAHRPTTVELADRVAWLEDGTVVAIGTHDELLVHAGYRRLLLGDPEAVAS
jgi:ATP-binding cassette subfamily B protein